MQRMAREGVSVDQTIEFRGPVRTGPLKIMDQRNGGA